MKKLIVAITTLSIAALAALVYKKQTPREASAATQPEQLLPETPLNHLGIIMDGSRRWAKKQGFKPWMGHEEGIKPLKEAIQFCLEHRIPHLTLYAWSLENSKRPTEEKNFLFDELAPKVHKQDFEELITRGVKISFVGDRSQFPANLAPLITDIEARTKDNTALHLAILFFYGGKEEQVAAARKLCEQVKKSGQDPQTITTEQYVAALWSSELPPIDLLIRTSGEQRLSNFLPLQSAYSELCFLQCYWPELTKEHLQRAVGQYLKIHRRFGA